MLKKILVALLCTYIAFTASAQKANKPAKYPSLFWEITGNGLKKPSYLFGTMHVSKKLAFHLSDSFYYAIKNCDAVGLELNPQLWQVEMARMQDAQVMFKGAGSSLYSDFLNKESFKIAEFDDKLKYALSDEPQQVNSLLYRSYSKTEDFEENTYLDLYIYQTGRKLGKAPTGMENFLETEKIMVEAYQDMAKEKKKKKVYTETENIYDIYQKIEDAYRKGDLDLLDSLEKKTSQSDAFTEKFLYKRNEIQANSMDTIMKKKSLFVGVGAAHLPGNRGVIELLRKMGYTLRPIKMTDRDAEQKEAIDKLKVPVVMQETKTEDEFIKMKMPGQLYKRYETGDNESWQYADMENGSYYMVNRVKTNAALFGLSDKQVLKKIDSLLYENIPGKIISKKEITRNGYLGYDIKNKTRKGDIQRYHIFATPFEVIVLKMSGNEEYVNGTEADNFFNSIELKEQKKGWVDYSPKNGGFKIAMPQQPYVFLDKQSKDDNVTWQYGAFDNETGTVYSLWKKNLHTYHFIEEDTFDISLIEESFANSEIIEKKQSRKQTKVQGYPALDMVFATKDGQTLKARAFIKGADYYLLTAITNKKNIAQSDKFFNSFSFTNFTYPAAEYYEDTSLHFTVNSRVIPKIDTAIKSLVEQSMNYERFAIQDETYSSYIRNKNFLFKNDTTGEAIAITVKTFAEYAYARDTMKFWNKEIGWEDLKEDLVIDGKEYFKTEDSICGYRYNLLDTNTNRKIKVLQVLKDNQVFSVQSMVDSKSEESDFIKDFYASFKPQKKSYGSSIFASKIDKFFDAYYSKDTLTKKKANSAISSIYFGKDGIEKIKEAISNLKLKDKDYFSLKEKFIDELGYINDSCCVNNLISYLKDLYSQTADTASFQNPIIKALFRLGTKESFALGKELLLQDPPVFEDNDDVNTIFNSMEDSLSLAKTLFPEILQLASLDDYKQSVNNLLITLVDSNYLKANDYESYFSKLFFDAKIELKKQLIKDEKIIDKKEGEEEAEEDESSKYNRHVAVSSKYKRNKYPPSYGSSKDNSGLEDYAILLVPFYEKNLAVQKFFDKLLTSKDNDIKISTLSLLLRNKLKVNDTILNNLASKNDYKVKLYSSLKEINKTELFPKAQINQESFAKCLLLNEAGKEKFYAVETVLKKQVELKDKKGFVYFFKYKLDKDEEWQLGISGLQPLDAKLVDDNDDLVYLSGKKFSSDKAELEQFETELKEMVFSKRKSAANFFTGSYSNKYRDYDY